MLETKGANMLGNAADIAALKAHIVELETSCAAIPEYLTYTRKLESALHSIEAEFADATEAHARQAGRLEARVAELKAEIGRLNERLVTVPSELRQRVAELEADNARLRAAATGAIDPIAKEKGAKQHWVTHEGYTKLPERMVIDVGAQNGGYVWFLHGTKHWEAWKESDVDEYFCYRDEEPTIGTNQTDKEET